MHLRNASYPFSWTSTLQLTLQTKPIQFKTKLLLLYKKRCKRKTRAQLLRKIKMCAQYVPVCALMMPGRYHWWTWSGRRGLFEPHPPPLRVLDCVAPNVIGRLPAAPRVLTEHSITFKHVLSLRKIEKIPWKYPCSDNVVNFNVTQEKQSAQTVLWAKNMI